MATPPTASRAPLINDDALGKPNRCTDSIPPNDDPSVGFVGIGLSLGLLIGRSIVVAVVVGAVVVVAVVVGALMIAGGFTVAGALAAIGDSTAEFASGCVLVGGRKTTDPGPSE